MKPLLAFFRTAVIVLVLCVAMVPIHSGARLNCDVSGMEVSGSSVIVALHNADQETELVQVRITVLLDDDTIETLTSAPLSLEAGETASVQFQASRTVSSILDGPEPWPF
ncbi:MAG: hypothetical protein LAO51_06820 [Acidobacteriia bacterium]|nr:hypothetical protein [Terriglobia bacterium]